MGEDENAKEDNLKNDNQNENKPWVIEMMILLLMFIFGSDFLETKLLERWFYSSKKIERDAR
jgi:D-alanyl-lipoteichoic acid acyltransferase DltB (MBOAT superfamily)